ncbi:MAG: hypothetical protein ACLVHH_03450 [Faecalibacillus intestinalis]|uniref:hypothetical protein n=1 Tax=Faecalibacillus intestinalis TaxID=1982626 RepID=UPI00399BEF44
MVKSYTHEKIQPLNRWLLILDQLGSGVVVVTSTFEGKNSYFVGITKILQYI